MPLRGTAQRRVRHQQEKNTMPDAATILAVTDKVLSVLGLARERKRERRELKRTALNALYPAISETELYLSERLAGKRRNRRREFGISLLWRTAAAAVFPIDRRLARICDDKGRYWTEVELWDEGRLARNGMMLGQVRRKIRKILLAE
jgi:hypothetical protein